MIYIVSHTYLARFTIYASSRLSQSEDHVVASCKSGPHKRCHTILIHTYDFEEVTITISTKRSKSSRVGAFAQRSDTEPCSSSHSIIHSLSSAKHHDSNLQYKNNMCRTISKPRILICRRMCIDKHELPHPWIRHITCNSYNTVFSYLLVLPERILKTNSVTYLAMWFNVCSFRQDKVHRCNVIRTRGAVAHANQYTFRDISRCEALK